MTRETLLTVKEFAGLIRVHPLTVYRRIWRHQQPGVFRVGRDIRIDVSEALGPASEPELQPLGLHGLYKSV